MYLEEKEWNSFIWLGKLEGMYLWIVRPQMTLEIRWNQIRKRI